MTTEELETIRARTKRAEELIAIIDKLDAAHLCGNPKGTISAKLYVWNTNDQILEEDLLKKVIETGRRKLLEDLKAELAAL